MQLKFAAFQLRSDFYFVNWFHEAVAKTQLLLRFVTEETHDAAAAAATDAASTATAAE